MIKKWSTHGFSVFSGHACYRFLNWRGECSECVDLDNQGLLTEQRISRHGKQTRWRIQRGSEPAIIE